MPDTRSHRGAHPEDGALFANSQWPALQRATGDLSWLLDHGYAHRSALALVGDRHGLTQRQRLAIGRGACSAEQRLMRQSRERSIGQLAHAELWIDGYNLLITIEAALGGGVIFRGRDGCYRDLASQHGTYRTVEETTPALQLIGEMLNQWQVAQCHWFLDQPVSNSGRLKTLMLETAGHAGWPWDVSLEFNPDKVLAESHAIVATSDSVILDRCSAWANIARAVIDQCLPTARIVPLTLSSAAE